MNHRLLGKNEILYMFIPCFLFSIKQNLYLLGYNFEIEKYSVKYTMLGIMSLYIISSRITDYVKGKLFIKNFNFKIEFEIEERKYSFKGFLDIKLKVLFSILKL